MRSSTLYGLPFLMNEYVDPQPHRPPNGRVFADLAVTVHVDRPIVRYLDVVVTHPTDRSPRLGTSVRVAAAAEVDKFKHCVRHFAVTKQNLIPFSFETSGALSLAGVEMLDDMRRIAKSRGKMLTYYDMLVRVSVALQRGNGRMIACFAA